jgi:hypothetical protein
MDFPDLAPPPKHAPPPAPAAQRPVMGSGPGANGPAPAQSAGWAKRPEEPSGRPSLPPPPKLDNDWAEDDDDGMDFSKPIVINTDDDDKAPVVGTGAGGTDSPLDAKEAAKMLAIKKQAELAQAAESMVMQQRNQERQAIQSEQRQNEEREAERRREMEERSRDIETRRREQEEAVARHRAEMEARRAEELARREEEARKREEAEKLRAEERERQRQAEKELLATQQQYMTESVQAAKLRRQEEEAAAEAERKARAEAKLAELNRRAAERQAAEEAERAKKEASNPSAPQPLERAGMGSMSRPSPSEQGRSAPAPRSSPWNNPHPTEVPDLEAAQWAALRKDDRPPLQGKAPAEGRGGGYCSAYGGFARGGGPKDAPPFGSGDGSGRGSGGSRQLYDHKNNRFVVDDDQGLTQVRKHAQEREEREAKEREKRAAKEAARKEQAEKEAAQGPSREELKKMALEERRKREAQKKAREAEVATEEIQNADPQRGPSAKGKARPRSQGNTTTQSGEGAGTCKKKDAAEDSMAMPINSDFLYSESARPAVSAWTGSNFADVWSAKAAEVSSMDAGGVMSRGNRQVMQYQQGRSSDKGAGDEGARKMQDDNEVAAKMADFLLDNDEHSPEKIDEAAPVSAAPNVLGNMGGFNASGWQPAGVTGWSAVPGGATWDGGPFAGNLAFGGVGLLPSLSLASHQHQVWDSTAGLAGHEFTNTQWAAQAANVPQTWSAQPQTSLQSDSMADAGAGAGVHVDKMQHGGDNKRHGNQGKGKQRDKRAGAGKGAGQKKESGEAGAASKSSDKGNDKGNDKESSAPAEQAMSGQQGAGRGANKGARGGHSASSASRNKQQRAPKAAGGDGEQQASAAGDNKEGGGDSGSKPAPRPRGKQAVLPPDIKQRAEALVKEREAATGSSAHANKPQAPAAEPAQ